VLLPIFSLKLHVQLGLGIVIFVGRVLYNFLFNNYVCIRYFWVNAQVMRCLYWLEW